MSHNNDSKFDWNWLFINDFITIAIRNELKTRHARAQPKHDSVSEVVQKSNGNTKIRWRKIILWFFCLFVRFISSVILFLQLRMNYKMWLPTNSKERYITRYTCADSTWTEIRIATKVCGLKSLSVCNWASRLQTAIERDFDVNFPLKFICRIPASWMLLLKERKSKNLEYFVIWKRSAQLRYKATKCQSM